MLSLIVQVSKILAYLAISEMALVEVCLSHCSGPVIQRSIEDFRGREGIYAVMVSQMMLQGGTKES